MDPDEFKKILENFPSIINADLPHIRHAFVCRGTAIGLIAAIPIDLFGDFFAELSKIGTEYIYILTCCAAANVPAMQAELGKIITKQIAEKEPLKQAYKQKMARI